MVDAGDFIFGVLDKKKLDISIWAKNHITIYLQINLKVLSD